MGGAVADGERAVALVSNKPHYYANLGYARYCRHELAAALDDLNRALALDPEDIWALGYRGLCYQLLGEHEQAIGDFDRVLSLSEEPSPHMLLDRAVSYAALERFDEAIADCAEAELHSDHEDYRVFMCRGYCHYRMGELYTALGDLTRAIGLNSGAGKHHLWRGLVYRALGDEAAAASDLAHFVATHEGGAAKALQEIASAMDLVAAAALA